MKAEDFAAWVAAISGMSEGQRSEAMAAPEKASVVGGAAGASTKQGGRRGRQRDALDADRSERVPLAAAPAALLRRSSRRAPNHARLLKRRHRLRALALAHPRNRRHPSRKILSLHRIAPSIRTSLTKSTDNAIRATFRCR